GGDGNCLARVAQIAPAHSDVDLGLLTVEAPIRCMKAHSGMCVRIIRAVGRGAARPDANAEQAWLRVAACPHAAARTIGITLTSGIPPFRILRPIQRETIANKPFPEIDAADRTGRNRTPILILGYRGATKGGARMRDVTAPLASHLRSRLAEFPPS